MVVVLWETDEELAQSLQTEELALGVFVVLFDEVVGSQVAHVLLLVGSTGLLLLELQTAQLLLGSFDLLLLLLLALQSAQLLVGSAPLVTQTGLPVMTVVTTLQTGCWLDGAASANERPAAATRIDRTIVVDCYWKLERVTKVSWLRKERGDTKVVIVCIESRSWKKVRTSSSRETAGGFHLLQDCAVPLLGSRHVASLVSTGIPGMGTHC